MGSIGGGIGPSYGGAWSPQAFRGPDNVPVAWTPDITIIDAPRWLDVASIVVAALGGAVFATRRGVTLTGVLMIAVAAGLGGGIIRDLLLDLGPPLAVSDPAYLPAAALAALGGLLVVRLTTHLATPLMVLDSLALGLFSVVAVERALLADYPPATAVLVGVVTASAGGIIRDLLVGEAPTVMQAGPWDASAALVGSSVMVLLTAGLGIPTRVVEWPVLVGIAVVSALSYRLGWRAPMAGDVTPLVDRPIDALRRRAQVRSAAAEARPPRVIRVRPRLMRASSALPDGPAEGSADGQG